MIFAKVKGHRYLEKMILFCFIVLMWIAWLTLINGGIYVNTQSYDHTLLVDIRLYHKVRLLINTLNKWALYRQITTMI